MLSNQFSKILLSATLLLPLASLSTKPALANHLNFKVHNQTRASIQQLYVSNSGHSDWEENVFGRNVLPAGRSRMVNFVGNHQGCLYDILAVFSDGDRVVDTQVNLCQVSNVTFN
jgi:hypothetical protein